MDEIVTGFTIHSNQAKPMMKGLRSHSGSSEYEHSPLAHGNIRVEGGFIAAYASDRFRAVRIQAQPLKQHDSSWVPERIAGEGDWFIPRDAMDWILRTLQGRAPRTVTMAWHVGEKFDTLTVRIEPFVRASDLTYRAASFVVGHGMRMPPVWTIIEAAKNKPLLSDVPVVLKPKYIGDITDIVSDNPVLMRSGQSSSEKAAPVFWEMAPDGYGFEAHGIVQPVMAPGLIESWHSAVVEYNRVLEVAASGT